jgi:hypothetical protein
MGRIKTGNGHDGRPNFAARSGEPTLGAHHGPSPARAQEAADHDRATLGKAPKAKGYAVPIHNAMHARQIAGAGVGGMGHGTAIVSGGEVIGTSSAAAPLAHAYGNGIPKIRGAAPVKEGMRSRIGDPARSLNDATPHCITGKMLMDEAK